MRQLRRHAHCAANRIDHISLFALREGPTDVTLLLGAADRELLAALEAVGGGVRLPGGLQRRPGGGLEGGEALEGEQRDEIGLHLLDRVSPTLECLVEAAPEAPAALEGALDGAPDLVLSDMAANTVGHKATDHLRTMGLVETAAHFAIENLAPGGAFIAKVLAGGTNTDLLALLKQHFTTVKHAKPPASRKDSSEWYVIAQGFKGRSGE